MSSIEQWRPNMDAKLHFVVTLARRIAQTRVFEVGECVGFEEGRNFNIVSLREDRAHIEKKDLKTGEVTSMVIGLPELFRMNDYLVISFGMAASDLERARRQAGRQTSI